MNKKQFQSGNVHYVIIFTLIVALLGALGFVFWQNFVQTKTTSNKPSLITASSSELSNVAVDDTKYFFISEWGVKGFYDSQYGLAYQIKAKFNPQQYIELYSFDIPEACQQGAVLGYIGRYSATDLVKGHGDVEISNPKTSQHNYINHSFGDNLRKIGDSYYLFEQGEADVCNNIASGDDVGSQILLNIKRFFLTLQEY